jgi:hypothetical protein
MLPKGGITNEHQKMQLAYRIAFTVRIMSGRLIMGTAEGD